MNQAGREGLEEHLQLVLLPQNEEEGQEHLALQPVLDFPALLQRKFRSVKKFVLLIAGNNSFPDVDEHPLLGVLSNHRTKVLGSEEGGVNHLATIGESFGHSPLEGRHEGEAHHQPQPVGILHNEVALLDGVGDVGDDGVDVVPNDVAGHCCTSLKSFAFIT